MKKYSILMVMAIGLIGLSCTKEDDSKEENDTLATYLNGTYKVEQVAYDGEVDVVFGSLPVSGVDTEPEGDYVFNSSNSTVTYDVEGTLRFNPPFGGDPIDVPIEVNSTNASLSVVSESSFTIEDETWGLMTYEVNNRDPNGMEATTRLASDTAGFDMEMRITFKK